MTVIVGFEGAVVPQAAGLLPVVAVAGDGLELLRCTPHHMERVAMDKVEFDRAVERGLFHRFERELETATPAPVLLYLPERPLFEPWPHWDRERFWMDLLHSPAFQHAFHAHSVIGLITTHTRAHDLLRLLLEETLGALRLASPGWRRHERGDPRLFLRSASALLNDENLRERVFAVLFAQVADDEAKWNALLRDARREFSADALERIKLDAQALRPPRELSASAG
ncbi:MAG: hypothetical protein JNJ54_01225 [Myxococcaceae bacterium]|nr:hypothetical protein [Myxococcaceae bacterium]